MRGANRFIRDLKKKGMIDDQPMKLENQPVCCVDHVDVTTPRKKEFFPYRNLFLCYVLYTGFRMLFFAECAATGRNVFLLAWATTLTFFFRAFEIFFFFFLRNDARPHPVGAQSPPCFTRRGARTVPLPSKTFLFVFLLFVLSFHCSPPCRAHFHQIPAS